VVGKDKVVVRFLTRLAGGGQRLLLGGRREDDVVAVLDTDWTVYAGLPQFFGAVRPGAFGSNLLHGVDGAGQPVTSHIVDVEMPKDAFDRLVLVQELPAQQAVAVREAKDSWLSQPSGFDLKELGLDALYKHVWADGSRNSGRSASGARCCNRFVSAA
jgi:hypothetical protein